MTSDPILNLLIIISGILCVTFLIFSLYSFYIYHPTVKRRRAITKQGRLDYKKARGTSHLQMLMKGRKDLDIRLTDLNIEINADEQALQTLKQAEKTRLIQTLETYIAKNHLHEIPGIGPKLRESLLSYAFNGRLNDLRYASSRIQGIGQSRQYSINAWIHLWEQRIPTMLEQDFPGKREVLNQNASQKAEIIARLKALQDKKTHWEEILAKANFEIKNLSQVKVKHFRQSLLDPNSKTESVNLYLQGVFPEWEPIPEWFKELITKEAQ